MKTKLIYKLTMLSLIMLGLAGSVFTPMVKAATPSPTASGDAVAIAAPSGSTGYTILDKNGAVYNFGTSYYGGANTGVRSCVPFIAMAYTPSGKGYALLNSYGQVYNYGDSVYKGGGYDSYKNTGNKFVGIAYQPGTMGYTLLDARGHIFNFGTKFLGGADDANTYTALAYTPSGNGYAMLSSDGAVFNRGDSAYKGGANGLQGTAKPFRAFAYKTGTLSYTMMDSNGAIYNFGSDFRGGANGDIYAAHPFVGMVYSPTGKGYTLMNKDGKIYNYGDSVYRGGFGSIVATPENPACPSTSTSVPTGSAQDLAKQIIANTNIGVSGTCTAADLSNTAQGKVGTAGNPISAKLLADILAIAKSQKIILTAFESCGGGGHATNSNHYVGKAIDMVPSSGNTYDNLARTVYNNRVAFSIDELIHTPMPSGTFTLKYGQPLVYNQLTQDNHKNHLHFSVQ